MAVVLIKPGAQPRLLDLVAAVSNVAQTISTPPEVFITAGIDGQHGPNSLHYALRAIDVRTKNFPDRASKLEFAAQLRKALGKDYQVIFENEGQAQEHLHLEYDPA